MSEIFQQPAISTANVFWYHIFPIRNFVFNGASPIKEKISIKLENPGSFQLESASCGLLLSLAEKVWGSAHKSTLLSACRVFNLCYKKMALLALEKLPLSEGNIITAPA